MTLACGSRTVFFSQTSDVTGDSFVAADQGSRTRIPEPCLTHVGAVVCESAGLVSLYRIAPDKRAGVREVRKEGGGA